ncbi:hypothetical protein AB870_21970 [Pandoraea faecigallinarum]|uniref:hypothetical protein n=1 Tax=Pandoraea faecigallinarum TaxID=656179 RepID=UPI0006563E64|nr:hypothetical protein [Pandoraea faecigallinarum]AKM32214.3 hypothetical protein AB870_21970 [Pandoraea faecigallinarum]
MPYGNLGNDWKQGWTNVHGNSGVTHRIVDGVRTYLDISLTTLISQRMPMPVDPAYLTQERTGYRLHLTYQPTESPLPPPPNARLYCHPSGEFTELPLPVPGKSVPGIAAPWLTADEAFQPGADDTELELHLASGRQPDGTAPEDPPPDDDPEPEWPTRPGEVHISGASMQVPDDHGVSVRLYLNALALHDAPLPISMDGRTPRWTVDGRLPVCIGAGHRLTLPVDEACGWLASPDGRFPGSPAYAYWQDANGADAQGLTLTPTEPVAPDDDAQPVQAPWMLDCAADADEGVPNSVAIESIYDAPVHAIDCVTGHFKVRLAPIDLPGYWPCIPLGETADVRVRVFNVVTQGPAAGASVDWHADDKPMGTVQADEDGWAQIEVAPAALTTSIRASADAPYNDAAFVETAALRAIDSMPWENFELYWDGRRVNPAEDELIVQGYDVPHTLIIKPTPTSVSLDRNIALNYVAADTSRVPAFEVTPPVDVERPLGIDGLSWTIAATEEAGVAPYRFLFECEPWKSQFTVNARVDTLTHTLRLDANDYSPAPDTIVIGSFHPAGGDVSFSIQALSTVDGEPLADIPCTLADLVPDDSLAPGPDAPGFHLTPAIGTTLRTDAHGRIYIKGSYTFANGVHTGYPEDATLTITSAGARPIPIRIQFRSPAQSGDHFRYANLYPRVVNPPVAELLAHSMLQVSFAAKPFHAAVEPGPSDALEITVQLRDGTALGPFTAPVTFHRIDAQQVTISATLLEDLGPADYAPVETVRVRFVGAVGEAYFLADAFAPQDPTLLDRWGDIPIEPCHYCPKTLGTLLETLVVGFGNYLPDDTEPGYEFEFEEPAGEPSRVEEPDYNTVYLPLLGLLPNDSYTVSVYRLVDGVKRYLVHKQAVSWVTSRGDDVSPPHAAERLG